MTELENNNSRITKKSFNIFKPDHEILYLYKNYVFNERIKDMIVLNYDLDKSENDDYENFDVYPEVPKKLSLWTCIKHRKAIENFILFQYSIYAATYVERKILKETKQDVCYSFRKQQYRFALPLIFLSGVMVRSLGGLFFVYSLFFFAYKLDLIGNIIFLLNMNDILMKYQINMQYKLGRETKEFVNHLISDKIDNNPSNNNSLKNYYDKFFVENIFDVKFEKEDKLVDYLKSEIYSSDYHRKQLNKLEKEMRENKKI
jgi:hypothetical protein